jgi:hypothetical protein
MKIMNLQKNNAGELSNSKNNLILKIGVENRWGQR